MARIPYVEREDASEEVQQLYDYVEMTHGRLANFPRIMGNVPWILKWSLPLGLVVQREGYCMIDAQTRVLAIIKASQMNHCNYCATHNTSLGQAAGLTPEQTAALDGDWRSSGLLDDRQKAVLGWAESVTLNEARRDMVGFEQLKKHFSDAEIVELTFVIAHRAMITRMQESLWTDMEPEGFPGNKKVQVDDSVLHRYIDEVLVEAEPAGV